MIKGLLTHTHKKMGYLKRNPRMCQNNRISRSNADITSEKKYRERLDYVSACLTR